MFKKIVLCLALMCWQIIGVAEDSDAGNVGELHHLRSFVQSFVRIKSFYIEPKTDDELLSLAVRGVLEKSQVFGVNADKIIDNFSASLSNAESLHEKINLFHKKIISIKSRSALDNKEIFEASILGMTTGLDAYSSYLNTEDYRDLKENTQGEFVGIGVALELKQGVLKVDQIIPNSPASHSQLESGDEIVQINTTKLDSNKNMQDIVGLLRGPEGTNVRLKIKRGISNFAVNIIREAIKTDSATVMLVEQDYAYSRIDHFQMNSGTQLGEKLQELQKINKRALKGIILDLRANPGGLVQSAIDTSELFLDSGLIVYTKSRNAKPEFRANAHANSLFAKTPLVVLIDGGSASASEIVAGALQDNKRAILMGSKTFGKGSVQTVLLLINKNALKLTTAKYFTPSNKSIHGFGIEPDIKVSVSARDFNSKTQELIAKSLELFKKYR